MTPEIYWGRIRPTISMQVFQAAQTLKTGLLPTATAGLADIFTPISSGRINLNTASSLTLQMIPGIDANMAGAIIRMRSGPDGIDGTDDDVPLRQPGGQDLVNIGLSSQAAQSMSQYCDVRSSTFDVTVDVEVGVSKRRYHALLKRNSPKDVQILTFRWE